METRQDGGNPLSNVSSTQRQLPPGDNNVERIMRHMRALVEDMTAWVELKIKLTQLEIEERIEKKINEVALTVIVAALAGLGGFFMLVTVALAVGAWLGHPAWGFLIVTLLLFSLAFLVRAAKPQIISGAGRQTTIKEKREAAQKVRPQS